MRAVNIFWLRRDLRLDDNAGLYAALKSNNPVLCLFIFDTGILDLLPDKTDPRVSFIYEQISSIHQQLLECGSSLMVKKGKPEAIFNDLIQKYKIEEVYTNHDYEPAAIRRDEAIKKNLNKKHIRFLSFKDQVIFEKGEILNDSGNPYRVYTPYKKKWKQKFQEESPKSYQTKKLFSNFVRIPPLSLPPLKKIGFKKSRIIIPLFSFDKKLLIHYDKQRDYPEPNNTSLLGIHLRFGTISIRKAAKIAAKLNETWLNELIWREFFMQLLFHFPYVVNSSFNTRFKHVAWRHNEKDFKKWTEGKTGYPMVDAGMRQLNMTGFMHNRARMITAGFLTKHLFIDWSWGEAYFAEKLLDYELSSNNGNWQWAAGTGADAQPYFRIFNPYSQQKKFDADFKYIKKWIPEFGSKNYPEPMIDHKTAVQRAKENFKKALEL
jgi:deoxyribodipyrimidine photo-lyase